MITNRDEYLKEYTETKNFIEEKLQTVFGEDMKHTPQEVIVDACNYSLLAKSKRVRPIILLQTARIFGIPFEESYPFAVAIEMIHTYSLIHDDLPAMDNDDFRRGKPSNHVVYGEAMAILAGDALLNGSIEYVTKNYKNNDERFAKAVSLLYKSSGISGMIGGQVIDIINENKEIDYDTLRYLHYRKTGALFKVAVTIGGILASCDELTLDILKEYGNTLGLAFQIADDILDYTGDFSKIGKNTGMDVYKTTYPKLFGVEKSKKLAKKTVDKAANLLEKIKTAKTDTDFLKYLGEELIQREW